MISQVSFDMVGFGPILFGKQIFEKKRDDEIHDAFELRTWRKRAGVDDGGNVVIPAAAVHKSLVFAGKWLSLSVPGGGKKTFTKIFMCGLVCHVPEFRVLKNGKPLTAEMLDDYPLSVDSGGGKSGSGSGKRVIRHFPRLTPPWTIPVTMLILAESITEDIFMRHARAAGMYDGMGAMRIGTGGPNGMWRPENLTLAEYVL